MARCSRFGTEAKPNGSGAKAPVPVPLPKRPARHNVLLRPLALKSCPRQRPARWFGPAGDRRVPMPAYAGRPGRCRRILAPGRPSLRHLGSSYFPSMLRKSSVFLQFLCTAFVDPFQCCCGSKGAGRSCIMETVVLDTHYRYCGYDK